MEQKIHHCSIYPISGVPWCVCSESVSQDPESPSVDTDFSANDPQLVSRNMKVLEHVPRMIKSLAFRAETFNGYCARSSVVENTIKEVCFDMQLQFAEFFTTSIKHIRAAGKK